MFLRILTESLKRDFFFDMRRLNTFYYYYFFITIRDYHS